MNDLTRVLEAFHQVADCEAAVWLLDPSTGTLKREASTERAPPAPAVPSSGHDPGMRPVGPDANGVFIAAVPGPRKAWLTVGPCGRDVSPEQHLSFLLPVVSQYLQSALEVEHAANELAERYEEINLLYTISEILGRTVALDEAARTILDEVSGTVGARRGAILVHDRVADVLRPAAVLGRDAASVPPIAASDECSVGAKAFRSRHVTVVEPGEQLCESETSYRRGEMLSVPIMWTAPPPRGAEPLGVINLSDRGSGLPFSAGDQKLVAAIATQIGTAIQNARLVRASLDQERLAYEMQLAHDLQMKLLPSADVVAPDARVAARVVPAESVGGDFYNLFKIPTRSTGIMIGDVSGHGYQAALIMALTMSASAIQAQRTRDPGQALHALLGSVSDELETTEMFISAFYAIVDHEANELRWSNTGHPHAFIVSAAGSCERLAAADPPLGMADRAPLTRTRSWDARDDVLVLFTDGVSDARNRAGDRLGEDRVLDIVRRHRHEEPLVIVDAVFALVDQHTRGAPHRDDLTLVVMRS